MIKHFSYSSAKRVFRLATPNGAIPLPHGTTRRERIEIYAACREAGFPPCVAFPYTNPKSWMDFLRIRKNTVNVKTAVSGVSETTTEVRALEQNPIVITAVANLQQHLNLTRDDVIAGMMDAVYSAANSQDLVAAWREIGKLIGAYAPSRVQIEHTSNTQLLQRLSALPDAELARLIHQPEPLSLTHQEQLVGCRK